MKWFRLYTEIIDDPKIQKLSDSQFRDFIYLLCLACEVEKGGLIPYPKEEIAWRIRRDHVTLCDALVTLAALHVVTDNGDGINFLHWKSRQYKSDSSAIRTRRYRAKKNIVTSPKRHMKRHSDAIEQIQIQNREDNINTYMPASGQFGNVLLKEIEFTKLVTKFGKEGAHQRIEALSEYLASKGKKYKDHYATILTWERKNEDGKQKALSPVERGVARFLASEEE